MVQHDKLQREASGAVSSGVEALIERLREQGVAEGRSQAQRIVAEAEGRARWMLDQTEREAEQILTKARQQAERLRISGEEALRVAARDTVLQMKGALMHRFSREVQRLISQQMKDETFLQRLILEVARRVRIEAGLDEEERVEVLLPPDVVGLEELRRNPEDLKEGTLSHFVLAVAGDILRDGVTFGASEAQDMRGIRVRLKDKDIELELSDRAVAELLLQHLQPRFRALLEGIVK